jgi:hypothetical protein
MPDVAAKLPEFTVKGDADERTQLVPPHPCGMRDYQIWLRPLCMFIAVLIDPRSRYAVAVKDALMLR